MSTAKATKAQVKPEPVEVKVIGMGTLQGSGYPFLLVTSQSEFGRVHCVSYSYEGVEVGSRAQCDCMAAQYGKSCRHVLVARAWLAGADPQPSQQDSAQAAAASYDMLYGEYTTW